jgi:hypothetical protein
MVSEIFCEFAPRRMLTILPICLVKNIELTDTERSITIKTKIEMD